MLKLFCKFGESQWNPYWIIMLTTWTGTNYFLYKHEDVDQHGSFAIPSKLSCKYGESKWNPCWLIALTSSCGTNYGLIEHDQHGSFTIPSKINAILKPPCKFGEFIGSIDWVIMLTKMMGTDGQTDRRTDGETEVTITTLRPKRLRVNKTIKLYSNI